MCAAALNDLRLDVLLRCRHSQVCQEVMRRLVEREGGGTKAHQKADVWLGILGCGRSAAAAAAAAAAAGDVGWEHGYVWLVFWAAAVAAAPHMLDPHMPDPHLLDPHMPDPHMPDPHMPDPHMLVPHMLVPHMLDPHMLDTAAAAGDVAACAKWTRSELDGSLTDVVSCCMCPSWHPPTRVCDVHLG